MPHESIVRARVAALISTVGLESAAKQLGLNSEAVLRLAAGANVRRGSLAVAAIALGLVGAQPMALATQPQFGEGVGR